MAVYLVTGKLGSGKTLACVGKIRDYLRHDRKVATNLDIYMDHLATSNQSCRYVTRIPDHPTIDDFRALGKGQDGIDEAQNGLIVLDECGTWLNTRAWSDKGRHDVIDWMLHSRKLGWDVILIVQDLSIIDKQIRTSLVEFLVVCKRADRLAVPLLTPLCKLFGFNLRPPKIHLALVKYGTDPQAPVSDRWIYRAADLYAAYDTRQVYRGNVDVSGVSMPHVGLHCTLSAWHLVGRYAIGGTPTLKTYLTATCKLPLFFVLWLYVRFFGGRWHDVVPGVRPLRPSRLAVDPPPLSPVAPGYHPLLWYYDKKPGLTR